MTKRERILDAEAKAGTWLAEGNAALERGDKAKAEKCFAKSGTYLDRANRLRGYGDGSDA
jgi:hypothetical protein